MSGNSFWKNNKIIIIANTIIVFILWIIGALYEIDCEFLFYEIAFVIIIAVVTCVLNHKKLTGIRRNTWQPANTDEDEKWEKIREKEDFFALWAHQIKTPIAAMRLLLQNEEIDPGECRQELFRIESYVEMALNYLRFEGMSGDLLLEKCQLEGMVKQVVKKYSTIFIRQHLTVELENLEGNILTDEKWFCFVLEQILSNALKYTKTGGVKIFARDTGDAREIVIRDTGMGIRSEDLPRVFEKGYTGYNGRMDKKASGLGLYLCKGVCDKLGHKISIQSEENKGTDVIITIYQDGLKNSDLTKM
ncbi:Histidine kinase-, DNA gyrase B-, and HSP90-like ATPase [Pseudobutyrivibrio xylanivorans]|uniref:histidine kinase n=1 Tax=Pseudobutyrivibrio xylanivorans TaxID=185007 RepID=A0A1G5S216_PSEXY|nr:Histidine kinase-, DNA gyrase B-, and HSP90-like ATPase [Pseudobutyrivibrio xylanivorans]